MRRQAMSLSMAAFLFMTAFAQAQTSPRGGIYKHPIAGYTIALPMDAQLAEQGKRRDVVLHSREGYDIKLQTGRSHPKKTIQSMVANLESLYLGKGRNWSRKLSQRAITVGGLAGVDTLYEGSGARTRMVVVRGRKTVFVFGFTARSKSFADLVAKFDGLLASFLPAEGETFPAAAPQAMVPTTAAPKVPATAAPKVSAPKASATAAPKASALKQFTDPGLGFSIKYPGDWIFVRPSPHAVEFSGGEGTEAYFSTVSIRNVELPRAAGPDQAATAALANLKSVIAAGTTETGFYGEGTLVYENKGLMLQGLQMMATYSLDGKRFKKWTVIIPRPTGTVVHIWSYTSPEGQFDTYTPEAEAMRKSWVIEMGR